MIAALAAAFRLPTIWWAISATFALYACGVRLETPPTDAATCDRMCLVLARLGCTAAQPTPLGVTCTDRCQRQLATGAVTPPRACISAAMTVDDVVRCGERCAP